ncbi:beta-ketoacyl-ACP synthase II [Paenibacillus rhizovicinus]|uniref:3-oxoacyl-[acyl-carrier-protein] synthase 2 n=1 Tax=Paenibacillus rhizovicinus TaxID=2704463 RepID=A0A6C0P7W6_9BACL|nr:beta-ketoacyl-ACP synthase II [Paenibacillus rhizovicinus]QHW34475.1 beta-ketoacyl-ACP synthase II [Paenibacillus rhizovicinus]
MEKVVITGMGIISPLGNDVGTYWEALKRGESGIAAIDRFDTSKHRTRIAGQVKHFDADTLFGKKEARRMDRFCQYALAAADQAWADAGLDAAAIDPERAGVYVGSGIGGLETLLAQDAVLQGRGPDRVSPTLVPMMIANMAAAMISIRYKLHGPTMAPVTACSIGNTSIGEAFRLIRLGLADVVIAGGTEAAITDISLASFGNATALSTRNEEPRRASRPFDSDRDGFVIAEGAGIVVLESESHARKRNARMHAEVIGYGASSDAYHMVATHPEGYGPYLAMKAALLEAGISTEQVDVIYAHATSTELGDLSETRAIKRLFGDKARDIPVTAVKSMTGHMLGAAGGSQAIALAKSLQEGIVPPTINLDSPAPECDLDYVPHTARHAKLSVGVSNSFGFGGHNAVIVVKAVDSP